LFGVLEDDAPQPELLGGMGIGWHVIHINGFLGLNLAALKGLFVDERIRFRSAHPAGIDVHRKSSKKLVSPLHVGYMKRVGIGQDCQPVSLSQFFQETIFVDGIGIQSAIPGFHELFKAELGS
jgi:hypothetical protein